MPALKEVIRFVDEKKRSIKIIVLLLARPSGFKICHDK
jgi:hypothetical protein